METLWSADELAAHTFDTPTFLVDPILPLGGVVMLHGKRGVGKTQLATTLAHAVSAGSLFLGRFPTLGGPVVHVQVDMTAQIQQLRVRAAKRQVQLPRVYYICPATFNLPAASEDHPVVTAINSVSPSLVIWDTLRRIHTLDEKSSEASQAVYSAARSLIPGATHFFIHHDKKTIPEQSQLEPEESFRGSTDWLDSADASMKLTTVGAATLSPRRLKLFFHKARTAPEYDKGALYTEMDYETMMILPLMLPRQGTHADVSSVYGRIAGTRGRPELRVVTAS